MSSMIRASYVRRRLKHTGQLEVPLGDQQVLDQQAAGEEPDAPPLVDQFLADGAEQMGLAAARIAEGQHVFGAVQEGAVEQDAHLGGHLARQTLCDQRLSRLFSSGSRDSRSSRAMRFCRRTSRSRSISSSR